LTRIENDTALPEQVLEKGVTVICEVIGIVELLFGVNDIILPTPVEGNPMDALLLVQLNTVPAIGDPVNMIGSVNLLPQTIISLTGSNLGIGSTVIMKIAGSPEHPLVNGVTIN
jgi:hypothetical protein